MKRLSIVLSIIILMAMLSPISSIFAQSIHTPHEKPATAESSPNLIALLSFYSNVFDSIALRQYQDAQGTLTELKTANIPDELRYIIDSISTLSSQLITALNDTEALLNEASVLFSNNQYNEARKLLDDSKATIHDAQLLVDDTEAVKNTLADNLGISTAFATDQLKQNYDHLEQNLHRIRKLIDELNQLRQKLESDPLTAITTSFYHPTLLQVSSPETAHPGLPITISGQVTSVHSNVDRTIKVLLDNAKLIEQKVPHQFSVEMTIPPQTSSGEHSLTVMVTSQERYSSASKRLDINISRIPLQADIQLPQIVVIPKQIQVSGKISHNLNPDHKLLSYPKQSKLAKRYIIIFHDNVDRTIKVLLDNAKLIENNVFHRLRLEIIIPPQTSSGEHDLVVMVTPQERYPGISKAPSINISGIPIKADILTPVRDVGVSLDFKQSSSTTKTATDGSFTAVMKPPPFDLSLFGLQELEITMKPVEPWYAPLQIKRRIFVLNMIHTGLMLIALLSFAFGLLIYNRVRIKPVVLREEQLISQPPTRELPSITQSPKPIRKLSGVKGRILSAYLIGLEVVEKTTSIPMAAHITLREFLKSSSLRLSTAIKPFAELTSIAEVALYSTRELDEGIATRAEQLAATIKEELYGETT